MSVERATGEGIGQPLPRQEDLRLLRGRGHYAADHVMPNMVFAAMVRSPHAHARIKAIDTRAAKAAPGVVAVYTGADWLADGKKPIPHSASYVGPPDVALTLKPGYKVYDAPHLPMPDKIVHFVGEGVAMVIAETHDQAKDAAELVEVEYEALPPVVRAADAVKPGAVPVWEERRDNIALDAEVGDKAKTDANCEALNNNRQVVGLAPFRVEADNAGAVEVVVAGKARGTVGTAGQAGSKKFG